MLLDGYPRSLEQVTAFAEQVRSGCGRGAVSVRSRSRFGCTCGAVAPQPALIARCGPSLMRLFPEGVQVSRLPVHRVQRGDHDCAHAEAPRRVRDRARGRQRRDPQEGTATPAARAPRASGPLLTMPPPASRGRLLHPAPGHVPGGHQAGRGAVRVPGPPAQGTVAFACPMASPVSRSPIVALSRLHRLACIPFLSSTARRRRPRCWRRRAHSWRRTTLPPSRRRQAFASWTSHSRHSSFFIYSVLPELCVCL